MSDHNVCESCGQRLSYRSSVSKGVVRALKTICKFVEGKGINAVHIEKELVQGGILTGNQGRNATHMVRLGLLAHLEEPGNYCLTAKAMGFLNGNPIPKYAEVSKRTEGKGSHTVQSSGEDCTIRDFTKGEEWEVPGFEIRSGHVIKGNSKIFIV